MKTIQINELPKCNIPQCNKTADYDEKTRMGPWANLCKEHHKIYGVGIGSKLEKQVKIAAAKTDKIPIVGIPIEKSLESPVYVKCPHCGEERAVEPDANYVVTCESCDNKFEVVSAI